MLYKFELGQNGMEEIKNICCTKGEGAVDYDTVSRWLKKYWMDCKNLDNQSRSSRPKTVNSKTVLLAIEKNLTNSMQRVSGLVWFDLGFMAYQPL